FEEFVAINEQIIAKRSGFSTEQTVAILNKLHKLEVIDYRPSTGLPKLTFVGGRIRKQDIHISKDIYEKRIELIRERIQAALHFVSADKVCRSQILLKYFGETESKHCGKCDVCRRLANQDDSKIDFDAIRAELESETTIDELIQQLNEYSEKAVLKGVQTLLDNNELVYNMNGKISLL
ncbi:MAG: RecQ family zinc-binding domain-containing protein, partial [Flavobacteriales bacterium]